MKCPNLYKWYKLGQGCIIQDKKIYKFCFLNSDGVAFVNFLKDM